VLRTQAKTDLLHRLDADVYSSEEVVVLSIPVTLPYPVHDGAYKRANGELEYKGEFYQLVKQKFENDTLFMVCVKDRHQKRIQRTMNEFTNLANNLPASTKHTLDLFGKLFKDYTATAFSIASRVAACGYDVPDTAYQFSFLTPSLSIESPPPKLA
jgi:hypothetical protein